MDEQENMTDIQNYLDNFQKDLQTNTNDAGKILFIICSFSLASTLVVVCSCFKLSVMFLYNAAPHAKVSKIIPVH